MSSKISYRQQFTRCGKQRCRKCREGEGHGPYWYAYWSEKGRTVSKYIGVHPPADIETSPDNQDETQQTINGTTNSHTAANSQPVLRIYVLGQFRVERRAGNEWHTVDSRIWHRRRARTLLACLLSSNGRRLGREQLIEQLWPDLELDVAANRLNGAVHELRQILEPDLSRPATSRMLRLERDMLQLADNTIIWVDAEAFENTLKEAHAATNIEQTEHLLEAASTLYRGTYLLEELYAEWTMQRRDALQRSWVGLLLKLAQLRAERGAPTAAIEILDRLRTADPTNETALQRLMILLTQLDRRGEALQLYVQHRDMLRRDYESSPLLETRKLYEALRQGHLPSAYTTKAQATTVHEKDTPSLTPPQPTAATTSDTMHTRPAFQLGRHNQSPLVGRNRERDTMRQVMLSIEESVDSASIVASRTAKEAPPRENFQQFPAARLKHPHFLLLQGEPGIGKTRLAEELSLEAYTRGWAVIWSRAYEQEGTIPYRLWTEILRILLQGMPPSTDNHSQTQLARPVTSLSTIKLERLSPLLPEFIPTPHSSTTGSIATLPHEQERLHLWETTLDLLTAMSKTYPLLLVLDDLHWSDESSIELLMYLTHHLQNQHVLLLGTCRDEELPHQHKLRTLIADLRREQAIVPIAVQPLTHSQIGTLVSYLPQESVQSIQNQASGNPFFAEELARLLDSATPDHAHSSTLTIQRNIPNTAPLQLPHARNTKKIEQTLARHSRSLPDGISAVLERRLTRLSPECQALLGKAVILGGSFELGQLLAMTNEQTEDTVLDLLEEALFAGIVTEEGTGSHIVYHFWHPLIVSHLYDRLSAARRAQMHRRAAEAIKQTYSSTQPEKGATAIVYHLNKGGGDPTELIYFAELAGNNAYTLAAYTEAQYYYLQAYQTLTEAHFSLPDTTAISSVLQQIVHDRSQLLSLTSDPLHRCRLLEHIAECCTVLGNFEIARLLYEYILELRSSKPFELYTLHASQHSYQQEIQIQAMLWREVGNIWCAVGEYANAYACYDKAREIMSDASITQGAAWACLHLQYGAILRLDGNYHKARRYLQEALHMLEQVVPQAVTYYTDPDLSNRVQEQEYTAYKPDQAFTAKGLQTRTERALTGNLLEVGYAHEQLGIVDASVGQLSDALKHMNIARAIYEQYDLLTDTARIYGNLGATHIMRNELTAARTYLHHSYDIAERIGDLPNMAFITCNLGDVANRTGNLIESENWFKRGIGFAEQIHDREHISWSGVELAAVQQDLGYLREAATNLRHSISIGRAIKSTRCIRYALVGLGDLRIVEAIIACRLQPDQQPLQDASQERVCRRLLARAKSTLQRAIALEREGLEVEPAINGKLLLATVYFMQNDLEIASHLALQTMAEAQEHETTRIAGQAQRLLGRIFAAQGRYTEAESHFQQALQMFRESELRLDYARTLHGYGAILLQQHTLSAQDNATDKSRKNRLAESYQQGIRYLQEARNIFAACHASIDLTWVEHILSTQ